MELGGRDVIVVGLGASGEAAAAKLHDLGARVRVSEAGSGGDIEERAERLRSRGIDVETGGHSLNRMRGELAVVSPGVPPGSQVIEALRRHDVRIVSEIELAYRLTEAPMLAVTGTNGKTTTTSLLATMLQESGVKAIPAGNIGRPLIDAIDEVEEGGALVAEVSSFQLYSIERFRPRVAVMLNIAEDHLDWHGSLDAYATAKARIFENQTPDDRLVFNASDPRIDLLVVNAPSRKVPFASDAVPAGGIGVREKAIVWRDRDLVPVDKVSLPGRAGLDDSLAAAAAALEFGADEGSVARTIESFDPLRHRLEVVASSGGISYIDDSKATNPHATRAAVSGLENVVLIAGGRSKGIDLAPLRATAPPVIAVVALGEAAAEIEAVFGDAVPVQRATDMKDAVRRADALSISPGSVLLAPGCASLDMFKSYAARGDAFAREVQALLAARGTDGGTRHGDA